MNLRCILAQYGLLTALTLLIAGCGSDEQDPADDLDVRIPVITQPVAEQDVDFTVTTLGSVEAWKEVTVSAKTNGQVLELNFEKGDTVATKPADDVASAGHAQQPLAVLEQQEYKLRRLEAEAALTEAKSSYDRTKRLLDQGSAVESEFDRTKSLYEIALARRDLAKKGYDDTVLFSPIQGTVISKPVEVGELVTPGTPLATIADIRKVKIATAVSESDAPYVRTGRTYPVRIDALPGRAYRGAVIYKSIKADPQTRSFPVEIEVDNTDSALAIGMVARVMFTLRTQPAAICVPLDSLVYWDNRLGVFVVERRDKASFRVLTLGERCADNVIVATGLSVGDELVVTGQGGLKPGSTVNRSETTPAPTPTAPDGSATTGSQE